LAVLVLSIYSFEVIADVTMGIFPRRPAAKTVKFFKPLAKKLSDEIGEPVNISVEKNFKKFWKGVKENKYDIVHYNQYHYLLSKKMSGYQVFLVNEEFNSSKIKGALTVRTDSGINSIADLKGKTILFGGGKKAMGSYIGPTWALQKAGLVAGTDYTVKFSKNPPSAVIGVFNKSADAAGSGNVILKVGAVKKKADVTQLKILAESDEFIHLPWAAKSDFPADKLQKIKDIMSNLKTTDAGILKSAKVTNFIPATDADFESARKIVKEVTGEEL